MDRNVKMSRFRKKGKSVNDLCSLVHGTFSRHGKIIALSLLIYTVNMYCEAYDYQ